MAVDGAIRALTRFQDLDDVTADDGIWTRQGGDLQWIDINSFIDMSPSSSVRNVVRATAGYDQLIFQSAVAGSFASGSHYVMPLGAQAFKINQHGDILFGESYLITQPTGINNRANVGHYFSQQSDRWGFKCGLDGFMIGDPFDINARRYGPENGYPWGLAGNAIGTYANLTAVDTGSTLFQLKTTVIVAPYGGDHTTQGAIDPGQGFTSINWRTTELGRDMTGNGNQDYSGGNKLRISVVPNGSVAAWDMMDINAGSILIGTGAINAGDTGDLVQLRTFAGLNEVKTISKKTGTPTSGTWKIGVWSVSPDTTGKVPLDGVSYATQVQTAAIPWNAAASDIQAALDALLGASQVVVTGGPLPATAITLTYSGTNVLNTHMLKLLVDNTSLVGGTYSSSRTTEGRPWGASKRLLYLRHVAGTDGTQPDTDYMAVFRGDGTTILQLDKTGVLKMGGQAVVLTNDSRLVPPISIVATTSDPSIVVINSKVTGDTQSRFLLRTGGTMEWGGGSAVTDLEFARQAAGLIRLRGIGAATATKLVLQMVENALTGTLGATNGSAAVVGVGTSFTSQLNEGSAIRIEVTPGSGTYVDYTVSSITDNTHLTLTTNFTGATNTSLAGRTRTQGPTGTDVFVVQDANGNILARISGSGSLRSTVALGTRHEAAATPTQGISGDIRVGTGKLWLNDAGTWIYIPASGFIVGTDLVANTITATQLASGAVGTTQLATVSVTAAKIANNTITATQIAAATITDNEVAAANKDGVVGTASLRTLGTGAQQAAAGNDARFTRLMGYAQRTTNVSITATTSAGATDAGLDTGTIAYDGVTAVTVTFFTPLLGKGTNKITIVLYDGATELGRMGELDTSGAPSLLQYRFTPSAGNHDYKIKAFVDAGTGTINADTGALGHLTPAFISIEKEI